MPIEEQRALWAAIRADPGDDTVRLVYADWLQENGDEPRAEFVRGQIEAVRLVALRPEGKRTKQEGALWAQCEQLLAANRKRWTSQFVNAVRPLTDRNDRYEVKSRRRWLASLKFNRGFLTPYLDGPELTRLIDAAPELEPLDRMVISLGSRDDIGELFTALARSQLRFCLDAVSLHSVSDDATRVLVASGCLATLTYLSMNRAGLTDRGLITLAATPSGRIRVLSLNDNLIGDEGAAALARSPLLSLVTNMDLRNNQIEDAGAVALAESPYLHHVVTISISGNPIGPVGWGRLRERFENRVWS